MIRANLPLLAFCLASAGPLQDPPLPDGTGPAERAIDTFRKPKGWKVELFAAEPQLSSPVAFCLDERGRVFVAEEYRFNRGTEENRSRPFLLEGDLQITTLDDRLALYRKWAHKFDGGMEWFTRHSDQVRLLEDRDGDGRADVSTVFAGGFDDPLSGLASGILARDGDVYLTHIPDLWRLRDTDGDGKADVRKSLLRGFGVNCAFLGHDLHGLVWGPDGRLYFSVGDRGFHVETQEGKTVSQPRRGAVFRCEPDGSDLEVVHLGLRNPQELAFDQFGNLFADDNNCDKGDHARLVYVVEGGDSGWNMAYQTIPEPYLTGPWHAERLWHLAHDGQPAWVTPPVGKIGAGPSGFVFSSGVGFPDRYRNRFLYCNYTGNGGVESFGVVAKGAGFEIIDHHDVLKPIRATDVDFGYDGKMYVSDFVDLSWDGRTKGGRIYTIFDPELIGSTEVRTVRDVFRKGFGPRSDADLAELLSHRDHRVRLRAQFALADRGAAEAFRGRLAAGHPQLARLHAVWGLGQLGRKEARLLTPVLSLLPDEKDPEVRAQTARVLGEGRVAAAAGRLVDLIEDDAPRVRFFAAQALGRLRHAPAVDALFDLIEENDGEDRFLRHAGVVALARINDREAVRRRATHASPEVRLASLLAQRRWKDAALTRFLDDADLFLVTEAARAIHDVPIEAGEEKLALLLDRVASRAEPDWEPLVRRAIAANFRDGGRAPLERVVRLAALPEASERMRLEAVGAVADWAAPSPRDRVTGFWRPLPVRDETVVRQVLARSAAPLLAKTSGRLQAEVTKLLARYRIAVDPQGFLSRVRDRTLDGMSRVAALRYLSSVKADGLAKAVDEALEDSAPLLRAEARDLLTGLNPARALSLLAATADDASAPIAERQRALASMASIKLDSADKVLDAWARRLSEGAVPPELRLDAADMLEAAASPSRRAQVGKYRTEIGRGRFGKFGASLVGGDAEAGRRLFVGHAAAQCIRCHAVKGAGGKAGPDLAGVATRYPENTREFLLESLLDPNARIAPEFGTVAVQLDDGSIVSGIVRKEDGKTLILESPERGRVKIDPERIVRRTEPRSAMPPMDRAITPRQARDLVEFLSTLK